MISGFNGSDQYRSPYFWLPPVDYNIATFLQEKKNNKLHSRDYIFNKMVHNWIETKCKSNINKNERRKKKGKKIEKEEIKEWREGNYC